MGSKASKNQREHQSDDKPKAKSGFFGFFAVFFRKKAKTTASSEDLQSDQAKEEEPEKTEPEKAESKMSEPDTLPDDDDIDNENALLGYKAVAKRMAVTTAQPPEKPKEAPSNPVELDIVYKVPRSKVIVNPFDFDTKSEYKVVEKTVKAVDTDYAVKNILYELFEPMKEPRRSWKKA